MSLKYIFITGGVVSGLGKGIIAASLGRLLKDRGYSVTIKKFDPYLNIDSGTMNPYQHGEVFVTQDGAETDLDLGHYERFIDQDLSCSSNITTGKLYWSVIEKERKGDYLGATVQVIPHITDEIKSNIYSFKENGSCNKIIISEIGGTVGDIESQPFLEAIRQVGLENFGDVIYVHVTLIPCVPGSLELKSKPTQHSVKELLSLGIQPTVIVCRSDYKIPNNMIEKISLFCNVKPEDVIENLTASSIYEVPHMLEKAGLAKRVCLHLGLNNSIVSGFEWCEILKKMQDIKITVTVGLVGKYVELPDAYISVVESLNHGGIYNNAKVNIKYINSKYVTKENCADIFKNCSAVLIPGGFGERGVEGKINTIEYCRQKGIPCFGICLGMQVMVIEYFRNVLGFLDANSSEFDVNCKHPVIDIMEGQKSIHKKGGTMRLGEHPCSLKKGSLCKEIYKKELIYERHRHRYEFNNFYRDYLKKDGILIAGTSPDDELVEIIEIKNHPWFVGVQFHPEFKSRPNKPHPLFIDFVRAAIEKSV